MYLKVGSYYYTGSLALQLYDDEGNCDDITINLNGYSVDYDEGFISSDLLCENKKGETTVDLLKKAGIIKESYGFIRYNMGSYEKVRFDLDKIKEYDPEGLKEYLEMWEVSEELDIKI